MWPAPRNRPGAAGSNHHGPGEATGTADPTEARHRDSGAGMRWEFFFVFWATGPQQTDTVPSCDVPPAELRTPERDSRRAAIPVLEHA